MRDRVILRDAGDSDESILSAVRSVMEQLEWRDLVPRNARALLKVNAAGTRPAVMKASNTDKRIVVALASVLRERTDDISVIESDGMLEPFESVFSAWGMYDLARQHGLKLLNLSKERVVKGLHPLLEDFGLPEILLDKNNVLISLPVIKTHAITTFTGAVKNQWGCVPRYDRFLLHKNLDELLGIVNQLLLPRFAIMDGIWCMEGRGPTSGKPRKLGVILGSRSVVALDAVGMRLIGLSPEGCRHLALASDKGLGTIAPDGIAIDGNFDGRRTNFEPAELGWPLRIQNYLSRYPFFVHHINTNKTIFRAAKASVNALRAVGLSK